MSKINMTAGQLRALWDHSQRVGTSGNWPALALDWADAAQAHGEALAARLADAERDRDAGWKAFYSLREQVGKDRYPGLTNVVRAKEAENDDR